MSVSDFHTQSGKSLLGIVFDRLDESLQFGSRTGGDSIGGVGGVKWDADGALSKLVLLIAETMGGSQGMIGEEDILPSVERLLLHRALNHNLVAVAEALIKKGRANVEAVDKVSHGGDRDSLI